MPYDNDSVLTNPLPPVAKIVADFILAPANLFAHKDKHLMICHGLDRAAGIIIPGNLFQWRPTYPLTLLCIDHFYRKIVDGARLVDLPVKYQS